MSVRVDLGSFDLVNAKDNIRLRVFPAAWLRSANSDRPIERTNDEILSGLEACDSWICRSHACCLELCLTNLDKPERNGLSLVFRTVVKNVVEAKVRLPPHGEVKVLIAPQLWKQLDLRVTPLVSFEKSRLEAGLYFAFRIEHQASDVASSPRRLHALLMDDSAIDLRPPHGLHTLLVESYQILLDFSCRSDPSQSENNMHTSQFDGSCDIMRDIGEDGGSEMDLLFDFEDDEDEDEDEIIHQQTDTSTILRSCVTSAPLNGPSCGDQAEDLPTRDWLTPIIDAALRSTISIKPRRLYAGWRLHHDHRRGALQDIAPAMWVPIYLRGMSERACFIPTLARAIFFSIPSRTRSASLAQKLRPLQAKTSEQAATPMDNTRSQSSPFSMSTSIYLWRLMHQKFLRQAGQVTLARIRSIVGNTFDIALVGQGVQHHLPPPNQDYYYPLHHSDDLEGVVDTDSMLISPLAVDPSLWTPCREHDDLSNSEDEGVLADPEQEHWLGFDYDDYGDDDEEELLFSQSSYGSHSPVEDDLLLDQCGITHKDDRIFAALTESHELMAIDATDDDLDLIFDFY